MLCKYLIGIFVGLFFPGRYSVCDLFMWNKIIIIKRLKLFLSLGRKNLLFYLWFNVCGALFLWYLCVPISEKEEQQEEKAGIIKIHKIYSFFIYSYKHKSTQSLKCCEWYHMWYIPILIPFHTFIQIWFHFFRHSDSIC